MAVMSSVIETPPEASEPTAAPHVKDEVGVLLPVKTWVKLSVRLLASPLKSMVTCALAEAAAHKKSVVATREGRSMGAHAFGRRRAFMGCVSGVG